MESNNVYLEERQTKRRNPLLNPVALAVGFPLVGVGIPILVGAALSNKAKSQYIETAAEKTAAVIEAAHRTKQALKQEMM